MDLRVLDELNGDPGQPDLNLLNGLTPDAPIFRYMTIDRLFEMVSRRELVLRRPHVWDDPFENFLSKTTMLQNGEAIGFNLTNEFFAQCWTLKKECDGFWRNYCSLSDGVRIETTAAKLVRAVWDQGNRFVHLQRFVGRVRYLADHELRAELQDCLAYGHPLTDQSNRGCAQTLLIKRTEFSYEDEVRVLAADDSVDTDRKSFPIAPCQFIQSILFAPKVMDARCEAYTSWLVRAGFRSSAVSRSSLYDPWTLVIRGEDR